MTQGIQGTQGPQGIQGLQGNYSTPIVLDVQQPLSISVAVGQGQGGSRGVQGLQGTQGTQGLLGIQGVQGPQGTQGTQGPQGTQGVQGLQGVQGPQGTQGTQGPQGTQGIQGLQGVQGPQGTQGVQGPQGTQGVQGVQGVQGPQGTQGIQGVQGTQGVQGLQGVQGPQGTQGVQGVQGPIGNFGGETFEYNYLTNTVNTNPGTGNFKFNTTVFSSVTNLYISDTDFLSSDITSFLQTIDDSSSAIKGTFKITDINNNLNYAFFQIIGTHTHSGGDTYFEVPVAYVSGSLVLNNDDNVYITFARVGDKGDQGIQGTQGVQGTQGLQGLQGLQGPQGTQGIQGTQGPQGLQGIQGVQGVQGTQGIQGIYGESGIEVQATPPLDQNVLWLDTTINYSQLVQRRHDWVEMSKTSYEGLSEAGVDETDPSWVITKIVVNNDGTATVTKALNAVWTDRYTETYS